MEQLERIVPWLRLAQVPQIGPILAGRLLKAFGHPTQIWAASHAAWAGIEGMGQNRLEALEAARNAPLQPLIRQLETAWQQGIDLLTPDDPRWPRALSYMVDPPILLYLRGELLPEDAMACGIVGSRHCSIYGREQSFKFAAHLAQAGVTIVSGGARGIDTAAHRGALRAGGRTLVIQGCGLGHCYPPENAGLYEEILEARQGAILSELPVETPPKPENFPPRNRLIAGLSLGVLVVEANLKSGSLITARLAIEDYGREVYALPGRVDSPQSLGTHALIKRGEAALIDSPAELLAQFQRGSPEPAKSLFDPPPGGLSELQRQLLSRLKTGVQDFETLCQQTGLSAEVLLPALTALELSGRVRRLAGARFEVI